jgi:2-polyprenyl-3-methyl-5-hydroxy-6-metoxy-1,4-benzoquinol methylase
MPWRTSEKCDGYRWDYHHAMTIFYLALLFDARGESAQTAMPSARQRLRDHSNGAAGLRAAVVGVTTVRPARVAGAGRVTAESGDDKFYEYYRTASESTETLERSRGIYDSLIACMRSDGIETGRSLKVADIGCGAGTQSILWAQAGHQVFSIDINADLIRLATERAASARVLVTFLTGSADALPWGAGEFDVCIVPELLEHVENWERCLDEVCRIVKPRGYLFLTTTNRLCPKQQEFTLPAYSWYPSWLKRRCLQLARTTRKEWVEYAQFPAVNWFSPSELAAELKRRGYSSLDRFDLIALRSETGPTATMARIVTSSTLLRHLAHFFTPYTLLVGKNDGLRAN